MNLRAFARRLVPAIVPALLLGIVVFAVARRRAPRSGAQPSSETIHIDGPPAGDVSPFELDGTHIKVRKADGSFASDAELIGAVLVAREAGGTIKTSFRIDAVDVDPTDPTGEIVLYSLSTKDPATGVWSNACQPDVKGVAKGFPIAGVWTPTGLHVREPGRFEMTCTGGAYGKCVRWGYKPWKSQAMWDRHQACTRLVRADYCGDGVGHTRNGTPIDIYDFDGIQQDESAPGMSFEAAWGTDGAVCVRHTRLIDLMTLDGIRKACPGKLDAMLGDACTEERARLDPRALLFDKS